MTENFPKLAKDTNVHIHKVQQTPCRLKTQHTFGHHDLSTLDKYKHFENNQGKPHVHDAETMLRK